ncbi:hypothetical protein [Sphingorhabdus sp.]|jgi:hypothetical protein|uniref:hypothetical protein n=1 Tax=Sphingorhabdus sp. TaxID=1902408 RepID=UPI0037CBAC71
MTTDSPRVVWTFHGTALVRSYQGALDWLNRFTGCTALEFSDVGPPVARRGGCCTIGDNLIELMEPNDAASPGWRYLDRFGPGMFNLALQVNDAVAMSAALAERNAPVIFPPDDGFTFTHPAQTCGLQLEWADMKNDWDPRFGAPVPPRSGLVPALRVAWWGALVSDPAEAAARFSELWQPQVIHLDADAQGAAPGAMLSLNDGVLVLYRLPDSIEEEQALWGAATGKPHTHLIALEVADLAAARSVFRREGVRVLREAGPHAFITHPADCVGLTILWTDRLLPGDPRS